MAKELGDMVSDALSKVGITEERVTEWLGRPCGCKERRRKFNQLSIWAKRILKGETKDADKYLSELIDEEEQV